MPEALCREDKRGQGAVLRLGAERRRRTMRFDARRGPCSGCAHLEDDGSEFGWCGQFDARVIDPGSGCPWREARDDG